MGVPLNCDSDESDSAAPVAVVYKTTEPRTFKACRTCRLQKSRCVDSENPPCKRCKATGRDCVFEVVGSSSNKKRALPFSSTESDNDGHARKTTQHASTSLPQAQSVERTSDGNSREQIVIEDGTSPEDFTLLHLDAPITAVHALTSTGLPPSPSSMQSRYSQPPSVLSLRSAPEINERGALNHLLNYDDVISRGIMSESEARRLFQLYMINGNVFLPLFDPAVDTFNLIRQTSTFCLTVILAIALRADNPHQTTRAKADDCLREAQYLATRTLFTSSARLETIQGMVLLAAYSERNWFAVCHAYQMSQDVGLPALLQSEQNAEGRNGSTPADKRLFRRIRTALTLHHVEQEVASGTGRESKGQPVHSVFLESFLQNRNSTASDLRIAASVEIVQLRGQLLKGLEGTDSLVGSIQSKVNNVEENILKWFNRWDEVFASQDFTVGCFQRSSIRLQRDYAFIIVCSAMISKLSVDASTPPEPEAMTDEMKAIIDVTLHRSQKILAFITDTNDYKWYLQWAPTYSALFPAFTASLAFRLACIRRHFVDWRHLQSLFTSVADTLKDYPHKHFSLIIRRLSKLVSSVENEKHEQRPKQRAEEGNGTMALDHQDTHLVEAGDLQSPSTSNATNMAVMNDYEIIQSRSGWMEAPLSQDPFLGHGLGEHAGMPLASTDYMLDFNLFAASIQASEDGDNWLGRMQRI